MRIHVIASSPPIHRWIILFLCFGLVTLAGVSIAQTVSSSSEASLEPGPQVERSLNNKDLQAWLAAQKLLSKTGVIDLKGLAKVGQNLEIPLRGPLADYLIKTASAQYESVGDATAEEVALLIDALTSIDRFTHSRWEYFGQWSVASSGRWKDLPLRLLTPVGNTVKYIKPNGWEGTLQAMSSYFFDEAMTDPAKYGSLPSDKKGYAIYFFHSWLPESRRDTLITPLKQLLVEDIESETPAESSVYGILLAQTLTKLGMDPAEREALTLKWIQEGAPSQQAWVGQQDTYGYFKLLWETARLTGSQESMSTLTSNWIRGGDNWRECTPWEYGKVSWLLFGAQPTAEFAAAARKALAEHVMSDSPRAADYTVRAGWARTLDTEESISEFTSALEKADGRGLEQAVSVLAIRLHANGEYKKWCQALEEEIRTETSTQRLRNLKLQLAIGQETPSGGLPRANKLTEAVTDHLRTANSNHEKLAAGELVHDMALRSGHLDPAVKVLEEIDLADLRRSESSAEADRLEAILSELQVKREEVAAQKQKLLREAAERLTQQIEVLDAKIKESKLLDEPDEVRNGERELSVLRKRLKRIQDELPSS